MSDPDNTFSSSKGTSGVTGTAQQSSPDSRKPNRNLLLIAGGVGCVLLLCLTLLIGGGAYYFFRSDNDTLTAGLSGDDDQSPTPVPETPAEEPVSTATPPSTPVPETATASPTAQSQADSLGTGPTEDTAPSEPEIGSITFAEDATDDYEPVGPATSFAAGITEIHAIFDYSGLSPDYTWERVWYVDGEEVLRSPVEAWSGAETGVFDYFISNGGDPLPAGRWILEIYVQNNLLASGSFSIGPKEGKTIPTGKGTKELATAVVSIPTPTPTPAPSATPTPTPRPSSGGSGTYRLVYSKWDGGEHSLYVADTNGRNEQFILRRAAGPSWSPDGKTIFFYGEQGVDRQIVEGAEYVFEGVSNGIVAIDASPLPTNISEVELFQGPDWKQGSARWANVSPDGTMVAFDSDHSGDFRIYFLGTAENQQFRFEILGEQADWSPDSQRIVYRSGRDGKTGIWISNRDDSNHILVTNNGSDSFPAWSPDGRTIAFSRDEGGNVDIYTVNVDGSNLKRLTTAPGPDSLPVYMPNGGIIFRSARSGAWGIWKMSGSGGGQVEIIPNAGVSDDWALGKMDVR